MSREDRIRLGRSVGDAAREASRASAAFDEAVVAFLGINATDGRACDALDQYGQLTAGELAEHLGLTTGAVTTLIDRLERVGMVERLRDESDRRRVYVRPTPQTVEVLSAIYTPYKRAWMEVARDFTDDEIRAARTYERMSRDLNIAFASLLREVDLPKSATSEERTKAAAARLGSFDAGTLRLKREDDK